MMDFCVQGIRRLPVAEAANLLVDIAMVVIMRHSGIAIALFSLTFSSKGITSITYTQLELTPASLLNQQ